MRTWIHFQPVPADWPEELDEDQADVLFTTAALAAETEGLTIRSRLGVARRFETEVTVEGPAGPVDVEAVVWLMCFAVEGPTGAEHPRELAPV